MGGTRKLILRQIEYPDERVMVSHFIVPIQKDKGLKVPGRGIKSFEPRLDMESYSSRFYEHHA